MHKPVLKLLVIGAFVIGLSVWALQYMYRSAVAGDPNVTISTSELSPESAVTTPDGTAVFSLRSRDGRLYRARQKGASGVYEFLTKNIRVQDGQGLALTDLPSELEPVKIISDQEDPLLKRAGKAANRKHYFFRQKLRNLEVFGSQVSVHQRDDEDIYAFNGALVQDKTVEPERVTEDRAQLTALNTARQESGGLVTFEEKKKVAVNPRMLGISGDDNTYPALVVTTSRSVGDLKLPRRTIVSLTDGTVIQSIELVDHAMNRMVYDCRENPTGSCSLVRPEGSQPVGVPDADNMYTFLGEIYNFYSQKMTRDSFDGNGAAMRAFVNLPPEINGEKLCPNARWIRGDGPEDNQLQVCPGWGTKDIVAHEFTHGVVEYTAGFDFMNQAGALNEATADIFATGVDNDWQIGEDLEVGAIRFLDDPSKNRSPTSSGGTNPNPMPDRLFSTRYYCGDADRGGVHINMSVPTKAFYLMTVGGSFNGCTMSPVGKDKALLVWYQALSKYLGQTSNFRNLYDSMVQGCTDLYGAASAECTEIKKSMQAVELDQQPLGEQRGPRCNNISAKQPTCVGAVNPTSPPQASPTPAPTGMACTEVQGDGNGDGRVSLTDFETWRRAFKQL